MMKYSFEKLYLSKGSSDGKPDIYVNKCPTIQHELDGIRFLYRALKKNKRGVILNDPSGYGKRVQTVLFLSAILPTLDKSVLILCTEGKERDWLRHFKEWTEFSDDVAAELSNPFAKKKVLVSAPYCAAAFARRDWSLLVVDGHLTKDVLKSSLRAELRIWITSTNLKEDLSQFATFYSWLHPKEQFHADKYKANNKDLRDGLTKTTMLDAFMEDIVLRRDSGETPFPNTQVSISSNVVEARITKKNKDSTGTKIKRSKRKSVDTDKSDNNTLSSEAKHRKTKNTTETNSDVFEIGNFEDRPSEVIQTMKNTRTENTDDFNIGVVDADDQDVSDEEYFVPLRHSNKAKKSRVLQWDSDSGTEDGKVYKKINAQANEAHKNNTSQIDDSGSQSKVLRWDSDDSESGHKDLVVNVEQSINYKSNELSNPESPSANNKIDVAKDDLENSGILLHINHTKNEINKIFPIVNDNKLSEDLFSTDFTTKSNEMNVKVAINDANKSANDKQNEINDDAKYDLENSGSLLANDENPLSLHINHTENGHNKIYPIVNDNKLSEDLFSTDFITKPNEMNVKVAINDANKSANDKENAIKVKETMEESNKTEHVLNSKTDNEPENAHLSSFELKMKQMEELMLKKFKGSFLDGIF